MIRFSENWSFHAITVIDRDMAEVGRQAAGLLIDRLKGTQCAAAPHRARQHCRAGPFGLAKPPLPVNAMILESVYPTIDQAITDRLETRFGWFGKLGAPFLTWQLKPRLGFDADDLRPIKQAGQIDVPKLFIAGTADRDTTLQETTDLFHAAAEPKELWLVEGAAHVDLHAFARDEYERRVLDFWAKTLN